MSLFRQINSLLLGLLLLVISSLVYFQFTQTRGLISHQIVSNLNKSSASLGLLLKPHLETGNMVGAETLVNVVFNSGFYHKVTLNWLVSNKQKSWENPIIIKGVPQWFINFDLFNVKAKESIISSGKTELAKLKIEVHPALGYQELWRIMSDILMILSLLFIISIVILRIKLNSMLKPLREIAVHAQEIAQQKFSADIALPQSTELKDVVAAINTMSRRLKKMFSSLEHEVNQLKKDNLIDQVSNLPNRQYLFGQITSWLNEPGHGGLILAKFKWLDQLHRQHGYQVRDEAIKVLIKKLQAELPKIAETIIARVADSEFAFLITKGEHQQIEAYVQSLIRLINQEISKLGYNPNSNFALGVSERIDKIKCYDLLSQADNALQQALTTNNISRWFCSQQPQYSREQWRSILVNAISNNQFILQWQPILLTDNDDVMQREIYCRLSIDGQVVNAGEFMLYVELLAMGSQFDKHLLEYIDNKNILTITYEPVAINLSHGSLQDTKFHQWLEQFLKRSPHPARIHFEITESAVISNIEQCEKLCDIINNYGAKFGVDHCGRQMGPLDYLQRLKPHYVKLDQAFAFYNKSAQSYELSRALIKVAKALEIEVIVTAIEDKEQLEHFRPLQVDGYQGYISPLQDILPQ